MLVALSLLAIGSYGTSYERLIVATKIGNSCFIRFNYNGPTSNVRYSFTKDGRPLRPIKGRLLYRLGKIFIVKTIESDSGTYRLIVRGHGKVYSKEIVLKGESPNMYKYLVLN